MTEMDELKPCPFCNERLERSETFSGRNQDTMMHPDNGCVAGTIRIIVPKGNGVAHRYGYERELERVAAWNRRASLFPAGHVAVPVEPTEEMLAKAMREADRRGYQHTKGYINEDDARYLYAAMLSALPHNQGAGK